METKAWIVRAGADGEREDVSFDTGRCYAGWPGLLDLTDTTEHDDIRNRVQESYPNEGRRVIGNWAGQLSRFRTEMQIGDVIALPLKDENASIRLGKIASAYEFDPDAAEGLRHFREVDWGNTFPRDAFRHDLRATFGSLLTITRIDRTNGVSRLQEMLDGATRDKHGAAGKFHSLKELSDVLSGTHDSEQIITIRDLMDMAGLQRRTTGTVTALETKLKEFGLATSAHLSDGDLDSPIEIYSINNPERPSPKPTKASDRDVVNEEDESGSTIGWRVSHLPSANSTPAYVAPDDSLELAMTLMLQHNFSQLPVVDAGALRGVVTWESIALARVHGAPEIVKDAIAPAPAVARLDTDVLEIFDLVTKRRFILVSGDDGSICGIVTVEDLTEKFGRDRGSLVMLEELELRLRREVAKRLSDSDIKASKLRAKSLSELTMGSYQHIVDDDILWPKLDWKGVHRTTLQSLLNTCRELRNELMHFSPDPISESAVATLEGALRIVRAVTADRNAG